jgi:hypothetical protein
MRELAVRCGDKPRKISALILELRGDSLLES